ncbi:hypothetical protein FUAX_17260 [Fulvitalea axinellae]|uniref:HD domain-containing protein n=1 Tax=Fulvitalea axinellae TaxID=1182444 RepID=A0AAU9CS84_9BACT|nr:hypothetical protein FUAX_17260 [Fulvitalea axinellae]
MLFSKYLNKKRPDWDALVKDFEWLRILSEVPQDPEWHAEGDVLTHTRMVCEALLNAPGFDDYTPEQQQILFASALMHDIEKASTTQEEIRNGKVRITSPFHAKRGEKSARSILYKTMGVPFRIREQVARLVRHHGLPLWGMEKRNASKAVIEASLVVDTRMLSSLCRADINGRIAKDNADKLLNVDLFDELCKENSCFGNPRSFASDYGRFLFLNKKEAYIDYKPFEDFTCTVTLLAGLPGAGKDTYIKSMGDIPVVSLDDIRRKNGFDPLNKKDNGRVAQMAQEEARVFLRKKKDFVFNATNIVADTRARWISLFMEYKARVRIVYIEVPYSTLLRQNENREYPVPLRAIDKMIGKLDIPQAKEAHEIEFVIRE